MARMTGDERRADVVWRSSFKSCGRWNIPLVRRDNYPTGEVDLISYSDIRAGDRPENTARGVHFFIDDPRFESIYAHPDDSLDRLAQYRFLLTPDYSLYMDMSA